MGTYVFALNTKVKTISNVTIAVAEYRYKEHSAFDADDLNTQLYKRLCARRVKHYQTNKLPFFFTLYKLEVGSNVYSMTKPDGNVVGACFDDSIPLKPVGTIIKVGRSYQIDWI